MAEYSTSIDIDATPEIVFDYLTTEQGMTAWMGQRAELDPRPGGTFSVDIAGSLIRGKYLHVEPPTRVIVSWGMTGSVDLPAGASRVEFRLTAIESGTRVELIHTGLPETELAGHADGWKHFLPRLSIAAPGGEPGADSWQPLGIRRDSQPSTNEGATP